MSTLSRREFLKTAVAATAAWGGLLTAGCTHKPNPPNVVLIMADDLGIEGLSCYGSTSYHTPALDELARTGIRFEHCYSTPLCTPSRVQIMTGKYNFRNYTEFGSLRPGETTFAHIFQKAGYVTCAAGKWQLAGHYPGSNYKGVGTRPRQAGFDEYCLWQIDRLGSRFWNPTIEQNGEVRTDLAGRYGPDVFFEFINDFMRRRRSQPFFVYYPMVLTHAPFVPPPDSDAPAYVRLTSDNKHFADMVAYMDKIVGRIVQNLDELGLRENTLLLFTSDNGTDRRITSRRGIQTIAGGKGHTTDAGTHVPLIANWIGTVPGDSRCDDLVDFTDFLPTMMAIGGTPLPPDHVIDGRSFFPQLLGRQGNPRDWILCHYDPRWGNWTLQRFARDKRWKLYQDGRLFDLSSDPLEEHPMEPGKIDDVVAEARRRLQTALDTVAHPGRR